MNNVPVNCTKCDGPLPWQLFNTRELANCPSCGAGIRVDAFPALFEPPARGEGGETLLVDDQSSCFYHPEKKAAVPCDNCGRFLCALCDVELGDRHLCPQCVETGATKGKLERLQNRRVLYDEIALTLAIVPLLFFFVTLVTAPIALFIAIRYWRAPSSLVPRTKVRFIAAIVLAGLQVLGWAIFFVTVAAG